MRGVPLATVISSAGERGVNPSDVLCSLPVAFREAPGARRFRFFDWNFHGSLVPFGPRVGRASARGIFRSERGCRWSSSGPELTPQGKARATGRSRECDTIPP